MCGERDVEERKGGMEEGSNEGRESVILILKWN